MTPSHLKMERSLHTMMYSVLFQLLVTFALIQRSEGQITSICGKTGYDLANLTSRIWSFTLENRADVCLQEDNTTGNDCTFYMAFCRNLEKLMLFGCSEASVCQHNNKDHTQTFKLGAYVDNPFSVDTDYNPRGFVVDFPNGGTYVRENGSLCTLSVHLDFVCKQDAYWEMPESTIAYGNIPGPIPVIFNNDTCQFEIITYYAGACYVLTPYTVSGALSAGSVLVIIFFVTLSVYCIFGTSLKCFRGSRGTEAIPNKGFWSDLPVFISDGIAFAFAGCKSTTTRSKAAAYDDI